MYSRAKNKFLLGSASVHYHMLNEISRTYFTRAFAMSSSAFSTYALRSANHVQQIQECTQMFDMDKLIEHLKTVDSSSLVICYAFTFPGSLDIMWVPTIENRGAPNAFLIQTPEEIYKSAAPPRMDAMFSLVTYVIIGQFDGRKTHRSFQSNGTGFFFSVGSSANAGRIVRYDRTIT